MADISQITLPSGTTYNIKDAVARAGINGIFVIAWNGAAAPSTAAALAKIPKNVVVKFNNATYTGTLEASADTLGKFYLVKSSSQADDNPTVLDIYDEYVTVAQGTNPETYAWEKIGDTQIKLTEVVTGINYNPQTSQVIGKDATFTVTQPAFSVTPKSTYIKATASGGSVQWNSKDQKSALTGLGTPDSVTFLKKVTTGSKKIQTTSVRGVQDSTTTASKATAATTQTTAKGTGTTSQDNTNWLKGISVSNEVLTIGAATMDTQNTTQFTFNDVTVPIKNTNSTTVANGELVETSVTSNVGGTIITSVTSSGEGYTDTAIKSITPTSANVIGASSTLTLNNQTIALATDTTSGTGKVQVATQEAATVSRTTNAGVAWNDQKLQTVLNSSTTITASHPS